MLHCLPMKRSVSEILSGLFSGFCRHQSLKLNLSASCVSAARVQH